MNWIDFVDLTKEEVAESALVCACRNNDTLAVRNLLKNGTSDFSDQIDQFQLSDDIFALVLEYGHRVPWKCYKDESFLLVTQLADYDLSFSGALLSFGPRSRAMLLIVSFALQRR